MYSYENTQRSLLSKSIMIQIYRIVILPVVSYECETWSVTLSEGYRLRMFENVVLRKMFEPMGNG